MGSKPTAWAASSPSLTRASVPGRRAMASARSGLSESSEMFTRLTPASRRRRATGARSTAFVERAMSSIPGTAESMSTRRGRSLRTSGSPPVSRTRRNPIGAHRTHDPGDLLVGEDLAPAEPRQPLLGHAVHATQVALVGHGDAKVLDAAPEAVHHGPGHPVRARAGRPNAGAHLSPPPWPSAARPRSAPTGRCPSSHSASPSR